MSISGRWVRVGLVALSLLLTFLHPLNGTTVGLFIAALCQIYLPGYLLVRVLGRHQSPHPISRFAWVLFAGLGLTVSLGAFGKLFGVPVPTYLLLLHAVMAGLALLPEKAETPEPRWQFSRRNLPLYILLGLCCAVVFGVNYESRSRFYGFEDQPIFISHIDWLATRPYETPPGGWPLRSRQLGVAIGDLGDSRFDTDGLTYVQAAWCWASGVKASQLIWYDLSTLFIWSVPLLTFALAYELTRHETAAVWAAVGLTIGGLFTLDNIAYNPSYEAFGRLTVFQINVLRQFSLTIMLPLALMAGAAYLRNFQRRDLVLIGVGGFALAAMHPFQILIFALTIAGMGVLRWLADMTRRGQLLPDTERATIRKLLPLALLLMVLAVLPVIQRSTRGEREVIDVLAMQEEAAANPSIGGTVTLTGFTRLNDFPILGDTYIRAPEVFFYHPLIIAAVILGLLMGWRWRRSLAAQFIFPPTVIALVLSFTPGLTPIVNRLISFVGIFTLIFLLPVGLVIGLLLEWVVTQLQKRLLWQGIQWGAALLAALWIGITLFEPFPLPATARDQLKSFNALQGLRRIHPSYETLVATLRELTPMEGYSVIMTPYNPSNVVIEEVPGAFITGGRRSRNTLAFGDARFYGGTNPQAPWLDADDLAYLQRTEVDLIVLEADDTRLPQLMIQPERFEFIQTAAGFYIFRVQPDLQADAIDTLFGQMNALYGEIGAPRWGKAGFDLPLPGDSRWAEQVVAWQSLLESQPDNDRARLGLAFAQTMLADDDDARPLWAELRTAYPSVPLFREAEAQSSYAVQPNAESIMPLLDGLNASDAPTQALSARALLTPTFFYLLTAEQRQAALAVTESNLDAWTQLAELDQADAVRNRASLLMTADEWDTASRWLRRIPEALWNPEDVNALAAMQLGQGDVDGALDTLRLATDADWVMPRASTHPDRWQKNLSAQLYELLGANGDKQLAQLGAAWSSTHDGVFLRLVSPMAMANSGALYAMQPSVTHMNDEHSLLVSVVFGDMQPARSQIPLNIWTFRLISPDSGVEYAAVDLPAVHVDGALVRAETLLTVPDVPPLTPALAYIQARHDNRVGAAPLFVPVVLNRPNAAAIPNDAETLKYRFGDSITLQAADFEASSDQLNLTLYWQTAAVLPADYQVFVHVYDSAGERVAQRDSAPVDNRYPTGQWRLNTVIEDRHTLTLEAPLPPGEYTIRLGLYNLPNGARLPINPIDDRVQDNSLQVWEFTVE